MVHETNPAKNVAFFTRFTGGPQEKYESPSTHIVRVGCLNKWFLTTRASNLIVSLLCVFIFKIIPIKPPFLYENFSGSRHAASFNPDSKSDSSHSASWAKRGHPIYRIPMGQVYYLPAYI